MLIRILSVFGFLLSLTFACKRFYEDDPNTNWSRKRPKLSGGDLDLDSLFRDTCQHGTLKVFENLYSKHHIYFNQDTRARRILREECVVTAIYRGSLKLVKFLLNSKIDTIPARFIYTCVSSNDSDMLRLLIASNKPIEVDMNGYTIDEMVMLCIGSHNIAIIKLLKTIWPFYSSTAMVVKAARTKRPAILKYILENVRPEDKEEAIIRALNISFWHLTTCHVQITLSCLETLPDYDPNIDRVKYLLVSIFKIVSMPETVNLSAIATLLEANGNIRTLLVTMAIKAAIGFGKLGIVNSLVQWIALNEVSLYLPKISSELLSVASLMDGWETLFNAHSGNRIVSTGHFFRFLDERLFFHELDVFIAALDKAPECLKQAWANSNFFRGKAIYRLLTDVSKGNIKALIMFMTLHPFEYGVIWYAWDLFFDSGNSDIFVHLINCAVNGMEYA